MMVTDACIMKGIDGGDLRETMIQTIRVRVGGWG